MIETIAVPELTAKEQMGFWRRVAIRGSDECWPWLGAKTSDGYGGVCIRGRVYLAHRLAWSLYTGRGAELDGFVVLHTCDRPWCMSPSHLKRGTSQDNNLDAVRHGRARRARGEEHRCAKLTASQVLAIRGCAEPARDLAARLGVTAGSIRAIRRREKWAWLD